MELSGLEPLTPSMPLRDFNLQKTYSVIVTAILNKSRPISVPVTLAHCQGDWFSSS
jgi:hypothetical protein